MGVFLLQVRLTGLESRMWGSSIRSISGFKIMRWSLLKLKALTQCRILIHRLMFMWVSLIQCSSLRISRLVISTSLYQRDFLPRSSPPLPFFTTATPPPLWLVQFQVDPLKSSGLLTRLVPSGIVHRILSLVAFCLWNVELPWMFDWNQPICLLFEWDHPWSNDAYILVLFVFRTNLTASGPRPNPQGSYHYGLINISRTIKLESSAALVDRKQRYAVNSVSFIPADTPLKLADYFNIDGVFRIGSIPDFPSGKNMYLDTSVLGADYRAFMEIVFQNHENIVQSWHIDGYSFWVVG